MKAATAAAFGLAGLLIVQAVEVEAAGDILQRQHPASPPERSPPGRRAWPRLGSGPSSAALHAYLAQAIRRQRFAALGDQQSLIEGERRGAAPRRHRVLIANGGRDDGSHGHEQDRHQQCDAPLRGPADGRRELSPRAERALIR